MIPSMSLHSHLLCFSLAVNSGDWLPRWSFLLHGLVAHCTDASVGTCFESKQINRVQELRFVIADQNIVTRLLL